jgi:hypothetical protein
MICLVDRSNLEKFWPLMYPGLSRAEYPNDVGSVYSLDDIFGLIVNQELLGYYQVESGYSGVVSVVEYPRRKVLSTFLGGKDPENDTPINLPELDNFLVTLAKTYEANAVLVEGRKGWEKWTKPLGYSAETTNLWKEVPT